jgi:hypothetical protein
MRRNVIAALALMLWGAGLTAAAVAQQPVRVLEQIADRCAYLCLCIVSVAKMPIKLI